MHDARSQLFLYLKKEDGLLSEQRRVVHESRRRLNDDENNVLMEMCIRFSAMGYGIDELSLLDMINKIISPGPNDSYEDVCNFVPATMDIVRRLLSQKKELAKVFSANSMDKQRADSATIEA
eukprot:610392-Ditylum_brightwellii.AAC.2